MENEITVQVLREIRDEVKEVRRELSDEIKGVRQELKQTREDLGARIDETNVRVDRLERRQTESEIRLATELVAVTAAVREVRDELREDRVLRRQFDDHERRIGALEKSRGEAPH